VNTYYDTQDWQTVPPQDYSFFLKILFFTQDWQTLPPQALLFSRVRRTPGLSRLTGSGGGGGGGGGGGEREREREKFIDNQIDDSRSVRTTPL
jgi:hypothetical protein